MIFDRMLRSVAWSCLGLLAALGAAQAAPAAQPRHAVSPMLIVGPQVEPAVSGPQYGLFQCQVGLDPRGFNCYDPYQIRTAYQIAPLIAAGYDGTGQTIVIIDAFQNPNLVSQIATYNAFYGLPPTQLTQVAPDGLTPFDPTNGNMIGWAQEISLDVEWAHNVAPGAKIVLVLAKSNMDADIQSALNFAVEQNYGAVISMSFGENESCVDPNILSAEHASFVAATQKDVTLFASSADNGASQMTCDGNSWTLAAASPASDPLVTGVGGTELHAAPYCLVSLGCDPSANPAPGTYEGEIAWNEGAPYGDFESVFGFPTFGATGGGFSVVYDEPPYQKGTAGLHGGKQRAVPDVAYSAAVGHGLLTYLDIPGIPAGFYLFGGTSAGSPQWSAMTAIADQMNAGRLGFLNKAIYDIGKNKKNYPASFNDVTSGVNSVVEIDAFGNLVNVNGYSAGTGWDPTTGLGSAIDSSLAGALIQGVSPGDGTSAIATTKPKPNPKPPVPGHMDPH